MKDFRKVPPLGALSGSWKERRKEIRELLADQMYGREPETGYSVSADLKQAGDCEEYHINVQGEYGSHQYTAALWIPEKPGKKFPVIVYLGQGMKAEGKWKKPGERNMPPAFLLENGYAVALCEAGEIVKDDPALFPQGLVEALCGKKRTENSMGTLAGWALGMRIVIDLLRKREDIDSGRIVAAGLSRLGKAALWCGACEEKIYMTVSFNSGCGGAAINRGKRDERLTQMMENFPHWLCRGMEQYKGADQEILFEQHFLLALIAPRKLLVTSSTKDIWSDPYAEFLGLMYAQEAYKAGEKKGIDTWIWPPAGTLLAGDGAAYYLREGEHGVEEEDWRALDEFMKI